MPRSKYQGMPQSPDDTSDGPIKIIPNDAADLETPVRWLRVNAPGALRATWTNGTEETIDVVAGEVVDGFISKVWATGTSAAAASRLLGFV